MNVNISREILLKALQVLQPIISGNQRIRLTNRVLIEADKDKNSLNIMALNELMFVKCICEANVKKFGSIVLNAKVMFNILRVMNSNDVSFTVGSDYVAEFRCDGVSFKLVGMAGEEFEGVGIFGDKKNKNLSDEELMKRFIAEDEGNVEGLIKFSMEQGVLKEMFKNVIYAVSPDETRVPLNSVLFELSNKTLSVVATDARRLSLMENSVGIESGVNMGLLIPTRTVNEVINILGETGDVVVYCSKKSIGFNFGDILLISKLIDSSYPNYRQAIPASCEGKIKVGREQLLGVLRRASSIYTEGQNNSITLDMAKNKVKAMAEKHEVGEYSEDLEVDYDGKDLKMSFDLEALMDPLKNLTVDEVTIELTDELSPIVIKCSKPFIYVLMPINLK